MAVSAASFASIDELFKPTSMQVARDLVGMSIEGKNGIYVVSATKPYFGGCRQTESKARLRYGGLLIFNMRGNPHTCISTGEGAEQDYVFFAELRDSERAIAGGGPIARALGIKLNDDGRRFADLLRLTGATKPSKFEPDEKKAPTCLGKYVLL